MAANISLAQRAANCDASFGPTVSNCKTSRFDFTLLFEQSILTIAPLVLCLLLTVPRIVRLLGSRRKANGRLRLALKLSAYGAFTALQLALLVLWSRYEGPLASGIAIAASALGLVTSVSLGVLSFLEHSRTIRPSSIICIYLFFSVLFDAAQCRTLWLLDGTPNISRLFTSMLAAKILLFGLEIQEKRKLLIEKWKNTSPEATSGVIARSVFWWLNDLLIRGFKRSLSMETLYPSDGGLSSEELLKKMLAQEKKKRHGIFHKHRLLLSVLHTVRGTFSLAIPGRLALMAFKLAQPFLLNRTVKYIEHRDNSGKENVNTAYGLIGAVAIVFLGYAISNGFYEHKVFRTLAMIRGALVSLICTRSLEQKFKPAGDTATLTLTGPDVNVICSAIEVLHEIWACSIEVCIAVWLLQRQLGAGCVGPVISVILCLFLSSLLPKRMGPAIRRWNAAIQHRVSITSAVLGSIKEVKMIGAIRPWTAKIQALRQVEMARSSEFRMFIVGMNVFANLPSAVTPVLMFGIALAIFSSTDQKLTAATAFTALSITGLIAGPLAQLNFVVPSVISSLAIFERLQEFIENQHDSSDDNTPIAENEETTEGESVGADICLQNLRSQTDSDVLIAMKSASFSANPSEDAILKDINLSINRDSLTVVTGKVGSGKSLLVKAILNELHRTAGDMKRLTSTAAYCAQSTWLMSDSIKQNIIGLSQGEFDQDWYNTVVFACGLDQDFLQLVNGDATLVGNKGMSLSGGQRHRIALARALYAHEEVVIADDVLSSLDIATQKHVWEHVFGPKGLLRRNKAAVIVVTHSSNFFKDADQIIAMEGCKVAYQGPFANFPAAADLPNTFQLKEKDASAESVDTKAQKKRLQDAGAIVSEKEKADLLQSGDSKLYWYYLRSIGWKYALIYLSLEFATTGLITFSQIWLKWWTEANSGDAPVGLGKYFGVYSVLLFAFVFMMGAGIYAMFVKVVPQSAMRLHWALLQTTMRAPLEFFTSTQSGDLINRFSQDMSLVDRELPGGFHTTATAVFECIGDVVLILIGAKFLAAGIPVVMLFIYVLQNFYLRTSRQLRLLDLQAKAPLFTHLIESADGLMTIRAFGWESAMTERALNLLDDSQRPHYLLYMVQRWLNLVLDVFVAIAAAVLVTLASLTHVSSSANLAVAMYTVIGFSSTIAGLIASWTNLETSLGAIARLRAFEETTPTEDESKPSGDPNASWPENGELKLSNIRASYSRGVDELNSCPEQDLVLHDVSLQIRPGEKVAICGRTGSGKSTLLSTLFRLLNFSGKVVLDGIDITTMEHETLRSRLITIPQEPVILPDSVRENLTTEHQYDDEALKFALRKVGLWSIVEERGGLDTVVTDLQLSHGQKQLLCLARAMLNKDRSRLLILDEAMSSVDNDTEELMMKLIEAEFCQHTVLSVVHRLKTVQNFDRVAVLDQGRISGWGTPAEMISKI